jgi:hypothetical protein
MIGEVVISSMNTEPLDKGQAAFFRARLEKGKGIKGKGLGLALKPLDSLTPYGIKLRYGFSILCSCEGEG